MKKEHCLYIWPDYDYFYQDEDGCCSGSDDDEITLTDVGLNQTYRIVVPGIYEWQLRYVMATDFADTTTESWFDWKRWHHDGLILATEVYRYLPRNYNLIYRKPFEDRSLTLEEVNFAKDDVDSVIQSLEGLPDYSGIKPSVKRDVDFTIKNVKDGLALIGFRIGNFPCSITIRKIEEVVALKKWMEEIATDKDDIVQSADFDSPVRRLTMIPQRAGLFTQMGQFRIDGEDNEAWFSGYVNRREFVRGLYLSLMNHFGFCNYTKEEFRLNMYPTGMERMERWRPYNSLRSSIIEWYITDELYFNKTLPEEPDFRQVGETLSMWVDYDCCFWDTMGVGCGDDSGLSLDCGDFEMDIPGLREWVTQWRLLGEGNLSFEDWWKRGWVLAQEVRKRLPENVDLYYMCYAPESPDKLLDYNSEFPKIIVPMIEGLTL